MNEPKDTIGRLIKELSRLPGIGPRSAERIVFHILKSRSEYAETLAELLSQVKQRSFFCKECFSLSESETCRVCSNPARNARLLCVVEEPKDVIAIEKAGSYRGAYHVLLGALSPLDGIGPKDLRIPDLVRRVKQNKAEEVILATNASTEGEATALYLLKILKPLGVKVSRIAKGLPVGTHIDYVDQATLEQALEGRTILV